MTNPNTSATGGYLSELPAPVPLTGPALNKLLQVMVATITGLDLTLVRPRWQPMPANQPQASTNWCGIGVTDNDPDDNAAILHQPDGRDVLLRHERLVVRASFYGPDCNDLGCQLRDGLYVAQNREALQLANIGFTDAKGPTRVAEAVNNQWIDRCDITITLSRQIVRAYPIFNLASFVGELEGEEGDRLYVKPLDVSQE